MFRLPPFLPLLGGFLACALAADIALAGPNTWWAPFAPIPYSAIVLATARHIPHRPKGEQGCGDEVSLAWHLIHDHPDASRWFIRVYINAPGAAGKLLALAGLQEVDPTSYAALLPRFRAPQDSVSVTFWDSGRVVPTDTLRAWLASGTLAEGLKSRPGPEDDCLY